ncbi:MAG: 30S ribosomal protein S17 [Candidatus Caenarcaniphilales bacterium]|nr:30S ribosomal protein S17 [Candidatus Caenarcaniphilales bacterium]
MEQEKKSGKKSFEGKVISTKAQKTVTVQVETKRQDKTYKKFVQRRRKFLAHNDNIPCKEGDIVLIEECRPISKRKFFALKEVIKVMELPQ